MKEMRYIYIYAFSRRFYPKAILRLYICLPRELNPQPFVLLT